MPAPFGMISGKRIQATLNGFVLTGLQGFETEGTADKLDGQSGADNGFSKNEPGSFTRSLILEFVQNTKTGVFIEVLEGNLLQEVKVFRDYEDNQPAVYLPFAYVFKSHVAAKAKTSITLRVEIENWGQYALQQPGSG